MVEYEGGTFKSSKVTELGPSLGKANEATLALVDGIGPTVEAEFGADGYGVTWPCSCRCFSRPSSSAMPQTLSASLAKAAVNNLHIRFSSSAQRASVGDSGRVAPDRSTTISESSRFPNVRGK